MRNAAVQSSNSGNPAASAQSDSGCLLTQTAIERICHEFETTRIGGMRWRIISGLKNAG
jgi:hypothetical protein